MEDIDKKISDFLSYAFQYGHDCCAEDYCEAYLSEDYLEDDIKQIKQALKDAGWTPPPTIHKVDYHKQ